MDHWPHRHRLVNRINADVILGQLAHEGNPLIDLALAQMPQIQVNVGAIGSFKNPTGPLFVDKSARNHIARPQFHLAGQILAQIAVALIIDQVATLAARCFGHQDSGTRKPRRMILHKLHVLERTAGPIGHGHSITGFDRSIGRKRENSTAAAGADNHRLGRNRLQLAGAHVDRGYAAGSTALVEKQLSHIPFIITMNPIVFERGLKEGVQHVEAGLVGRIKRSLDRHTPEGANTDPSIRIPAPRATPVLELNQLVAGLLDERLDHVLVGEKIAALDGIVAMRIEAIVFAHHCGGSPLGRYGMAAHGINLGHQPDAETLVGFDCGNRRPKACTAATDDQNIMFGYIHRQ